MAVSNGETYVTWKAFLMVTLSALGIVIGLATYARSEIIAEIKALQKEVVTLQVEVAKRGP